jgi:hypothetical protein
MNYASTAMLLMMAVLYLAQFIQVKLNLWLQRVNTDYLVDKAPSWVCSVVLSGATVFTL